MRGVRRLAPAAAGVVLIVGLAWPARAIAQTTGAAPPPPPAAQDPVPPRPQGPPPPDPGAALTAAQVEQEFDNFALGQAQRELGLADAQFFRFARGYRALQMVKRRVQRERRLLMAELNALIRGPGPVQDPAEVTAKLQAFDNLAVRAATEMQRAYAAIDGVLNVRQRVRFRQFDQQMERKKLELLALAQAAGRGRGPAPNRR